MGHRPAWCRCPPVAAFFSQSVKDRFLELFPNLIITDSIGSSESGFNGLTYAAKGDKAARAADRRSAPGRDVVILDEDLQIIPPGDERVGKMGRGGNIPLGYFNDPMKTAETFVTAADGRRYAVSRRLRPLDRGRHAHDARAGARCRSTPAARRSTPRRSSRRSRPTRRCSTASSWACPTSAGASGWPRSCSSATASAATLDDLCAHAREHVAGYKVPRELHLVDEIVRSPSGKPDYPWAKQLAESGAAHVEGP